MDVITKSSEETQRTGEDFAASLKGGEILALTGDLGSGKTTFLQGLAKGLGITQRIVSPTFIISHEYPINDKTFFHIDLYRLEGDLRSEIKNLGLDDVWGKEENVVAIEWAEKITEYLPEKTIWISFEYLGDDERKIMIKK